MKAIASVLRTATLSAAMGLALSAMALAEQVKVTIVATSDIYEMADNKGRGGFPKLATAIKQERAANPNTIVVNAGDLISPSLLSGINQGEHMIVFTNMIGTDVMAPGNHEFDFGKDVAAKRIGESKFPWIAANLTQADGTPFASMAPTWMKVAGGVKLGFIGLAADNTPELSSTGDLKFSDSVEAGTAQSKALKEAGADFVVAISHNIRDVAQKLLESGAVDFVVNGHNHDLWVFYNGRGAAMESQSDAAQIAVADINFDVEEKDGKRTVRWTPTFRIHDSASLEPDAEVAAKVAEYQKILDEELSVELGSTAIELDSRKASVRSMETQMGNLIADGMRAAVGADIAITNGGGIRGDKVYEAGAKLTRKDILTELPFGNKTLMLELTGDKVKEALESGVSQVDKGAGRFPQVSGLTFTVDLSKPVGERVSDIMVNGEALDMAKAYKVATNDFIARGGDGYTALRGGKLLVNAESAKLMANDVMAHVRKLGEVKAAEGARITIKQ